MIPEQLHPRAARGKERADAPFPPHNGRGSSKTGRTVGPPVPTGGPFLLQSPQS